MSNANRNFAINKLQIAIDKLIDLQDRGMGTDGIARALEILNAEINRLLA